MEKDILESFGGNSRQAKCAEKIRREFDTLMED
jgi:hypothetical protein